MQYRFGNTKVSCNVSLEGLYGWNEGYYDRCCKVRGESFQRGDCLKLIAIWLNHWPKSLCRRTNTL